mmetsp:Transcript_12013/g.22563  ORF Transcript_12013/g.22563 Transcript_12013/m.22563 type:complete len:232 (+) Transcript_12013:1975-2670(+)
MVILVITLTKIPGAALPHPGGNRLDHVAYPADVVPVSMAPAHTTRRRANNPEEGGLSYEANPLIPDRRESPPADVMPPKTLENLVPPPKIPEVTPTTTTTTTSRRSRGRGSARSGGRGRRTRRTHSLNDFRFGRSVAEIATHDDHDDDDNNCGIKRRHREGHGRGHSFHGHGNRPRHSCHLFRLHHGQHHGNDGTGHQNDVSSSSHRIIERIANEYRGRRRRRHRARHSNG